MRKTGLFLLLFGIWSGCDKVAEPPLTEQDAPEAVVQAITDRFEGVSDLTLTTLQSNMWYAADFTSQMIHYKAVLRPEGTFKNLDTEIPVASLPGTAKVYVDTYFPVNAIGFLYQNTDPSTAQDIGYFTQITDSTGKYLLSFDALGAHISTVKEPTTNWWPGGAYSWIMVTACVWATKRSGYLQEEKDCFRAPAAKPEFWANTGLNLPIGNGQYQLVPTFKYQFTYIEQSDKLLKTRLYGLGIGIKRCF